MACSKLRSINFGGTARFAIGDLRGCSPRQRLSKKTFMPERTHPFSVRARSKLKRTEIAHEGTRLARQGRHPLRYRDGSGNRAPPRRHREGDELRDLRF